MSRRLNDWIDAYMNYTKGTETPTMYRKWAAVSTVASVLRRKCFFCLGSEVFYPNLYVILVGPPACHKGTAMRPARNLLEQLGIPLAADESSRQAIVKRMMENSKMHTDPEGLTHIHSSYTIFASELTVFLKKEDVQQIPTLNKWYDCESRYVYDIISRPTEEIVNVWVNLFGATTPTNLQKYLPDDAHGSGFTSRTIFVFEEDEGEIVIVPELLGEEDILYDLELISSMCGRFVMEEAIIEPYTIWRKENKRNPPLTEPKLSSYLGRRPAHLWKLSTIFSASRSDDRVIRLGDYNKAMELLLTTERKMPWVFRGIGQNPLAEVQTRIMRLIMASGQISMMELQRRFMDDVDQKALWQIVATLEHTGFCKMDLGTQLVKCTKAGMEYLGME
jgi:hypothetical protein